MTRRIKGHAEVGGPEGLVNSGEVEVHFGEMLYSVTIGLEL